MSLLEIGVLLAAVAIYGTYKVAEFAVKGISKLTRDSKVTAIRSAREAAEAKRHEEALAELRAMDGAMARSTESLMTELRRAEATAETERKAARATMDKRWAAALHDLEGKAGHMDEAILALHDFHTKRSRELAEELRTESAALETRLSAARSSLTAKAREEVTATTTAALEALGKAEGTIAERNERHERYARQALQEAREMLAWIEKHYDCDTYASAQLIAARAKVKATEESLAEGAYISAAGTAAQASVEVQMLHVYAEQRTASFSRAKAEVQTAAAELMALVEASHSLVSEGDPEELAEFVTDAYDADFWSEGRLKKLWDAAAELQSRAEAFAYNSDFAAEADEIGLLLARTRLQLMDEYTRTRMHVISRHSIINLGRTVIESYEENGWEMTEAPSYPGDDPRAMLHLVFVRGDVQRDVFIRNIYDPKTGMYKQQIIRHVEEEGTPDEEQRRRDSEALEQSMNSRGVKTGLRCDQSTAGLKGKLDSGAIAGLSVPE